MNTVYTPYQGNISLQQKIIREKHNQSEFRAVESSNTRHFYETTRALKSQGTWYKRQNKPKIRSMYVSLSVLIVV